MDPFGQISQETCLSLARWLCEVQVRGAGRCLTVRHLVGFESTTGGLGNPPFVIHRINLLSPESASIQGSIYGDESKSVGVWRIRCQIGCQMWGR